MSREETHQPPMYGFPRPQVLRQGSEILTHPGFSSLDRIFRLLRARLPETEHVGYKPTNGISLLCPKIFDSYLMTGKTEVNEPVLVLFEDRLDGRQDQWRMGRTQDLDAGPTLEMGHDTDERRQKQSLPLGV